MSDIKRYSMTWGKDDDNSIYVSPVTQRNGRWVKHQDHQAVIKAYETQNNYLAGEVERLSDLLSKEYGHSMFLVLRLNLALNPPAKEKTDLPF